MQNTTGLVFGNSTIRQTVQVTLAADTLRLEISNVFGGADLPITAATVALPGNQTAGISAIQTGSLQALTFSRSDSFIVPNGAVVVSDPIHLPVEALTVLSISIYLEQGQTTNSITSHPGSRTTSYFARGNRVSDADLADSATADHWYFISSIEGRVSKGASSLAIVGDSITDGRGSTTNGNDRWTDRLARRLQNDTVRVAIVNKAAGGNRVLADGLGPNALGRVDRDVVALAGVRHAIIFEGVNDIGTAATDEASQLQVAQRLIQAYQQMILRLHRHHIAVFGATITPMTGPGQVYGDPNREVTRTTVNEWIRNSGQFDAVIDFDAVVRDPDQPEQLLAQYDSGDHLHLNPQGYKAMADAVDLDLFSNEEQSLDVCA